MNATAARVPMRRIRHVHFVGIGGAGMSGIAEVLHGLQYRVSGSDLHETAMTRRLRDLGIQVDIGHAAKQLDDCDVVVASNAISPTNPELVAAREQRIPVVPRAEMLGELMRFSFGVAVAGTHGKTTATHLIAAILEAAGLSPSYIVGGRVRQGHAHALLGEGQYLITEADESDASFLHLTPTVAVVTNIDDDHLSNYDGKMERLIETYADFLHNLPFYGLAVLCIDGPHLAQMAKTLGRQVRTYSTTTDADVTASGISQQGTVSTFTVHLADTGESMEMALSLPGEHNVRNALAAVTVAHDLGVTLERIRQALADFKGIARRFEDHGQLAPEWDVRWLDDYGHHPTEIRATVQTARLAYPARRLVLVFQPHRYSRTRDLFSAFVEVLQAADLLLLLEVYPAGEAARAGADSAALAAQIEHAGSAVVRVPDEASLMPLLTEQLQPNDLLLTMGAGSIGAWAHALPEKFAALEVVS